VCSQSSQLTAVHSETALAAGHSSASPGVEAPAGRVIEELVGCAGAEYILVMAAVSAVLVLNGYSWQGAALSLKILSLASPKKSAGDREKQRGRC
jgi:hypothetical protein